MPGGKAGKLKLDPWTARALIDMANMSRELFETTRTARELPLEHLEALATFGPESERVLGPLMEMTRGTFERQREELMRKLPEGGTLEKALADLSEAEASALTSQNLQAYLNALSQMAAIGFPEAATALGGLQGMAGIGAGLAGQRAGLESQRGIAGLGLIGDIATGIGAPLIQKIPWP